MILKKRKLKNFVLPTIYLLITICIFTGIIFVSRDVSLTDKDYDYGTEVLQENVESVIVEDTIATSTITSPVKSGEAEIGVHFYKKDADASSQEQSLIYYENTYLPNTGVLYTSDKEFKVIPVFSGKVTEIIEDDFFGKCIVVEHNNNLKTYYYGLDNIEVKVGDEITTENSLGMSKNNEIINTKKSFLLEVYYNNELIDPETFIGTKISDYN